MAHGGVRSGAGRKHGSTNKIDQEARRKAVEGGITPLDYMLSVLRDENRPDDERMDAAKAAAPYLHAKLAAIEHTGGVTLRKASEIKDDELANIAAGRR